MTDTADRPLTGRKVALILGAAFAVVIGVNLTLAFKAVATFPGLEVKNSYVASQNFDVDRSAQLALGWDVNAWVSKGVLHLRVRDDLGPVSPEIQSAIFGQATTVSQDQSVVFDFNGREFAAPVRVFPGNWNLRVVALADNGTVFRQRIIVEVKE